MTNSQKKEILDVLCNLHTINESKGYDDACSILIGTASQFEEGEFNIVDVVRYLASELPKA